MTKPYKKVFLANVFCICFLTLAQGCFSPDTSLQRKGKHWKVEKIDEKDLQTSFLQTTIRVSLTTHQEAYKDVLGVNKPPLFFTEDGTTQFNIANLYKKFGISSVRLHDSSTDLCEIYKAATIEDKDGNKLTSCVEKFATGTPYVFWNIDASKVHKKSAYDFRYLDEVLQASKDASAKIFFRIGESWNGPSNTNDTKAWATIATNIVRHLYGDFKHSGPAENTIIGLEIMNEPEGRYWQGSNDDFFQLFSQTQASISSYLTQKGDPTPLGGAGFTAGFPNLLLGDSLVGQFFQQVDTNKLDFLSAHYYGSCETEPLHEFVNWRETTISNLTQVNQTSSNQSFILSEWNIGLANKCGIDVFSSQRAQSYATAMLAFFQEPSLAINSAYIYAGAPFMGLFSVNSNYDIIINPSAWSFWAHSHLQQGTKVKTEICMGSLCQSVLDKVKSGGKLVAITVEKDGKWFLVLSNDAEEEASFNLQLRELPTTTKGSKITTVTLRISTPPQGTQHLLSTQDTSKSNHYRLLNNDVIEAALNKVQTTTQQIESTSSSATIPLSIPAQTIQVIEVTATTSIKVTTTPQTTNLQP